MKAVEYAMIEIIEDRDEVMPVDLLLMTWRVMCSFVPVTSWV